jgi:phage gp46-like protein
VPDIALQWTPARGAADLAFDNNDLATDEGLETAICLSLFTDRRVGADELEQGEPHQRGWWADVLPVVPGDHFGSRLWLLARSKRVADVLPRAEEYAREALAWLVEDDVAHRVVVLATAFAPDVLLLDIELHRPRSEASRFRYSYQWRSGEARRMS